VWYVWITAPPRSGWMLGPQDALSIGRMADLGCRLTYFPLLGARIH
jgi:hypothetical protein